MGIVNLLSSTSRVETPFVKVTIGDYTIGVQNNNSNNSTIQFPNFIQKLSVQKINGTVNTYTLEIKYPITENVDPNFFEKILSSVSKTRKIVFSYGDFSLPTFIYKDEEAIITNVSSQFSINSNDISYTITAISNSLLLKSVVVNFERERIAKASDVIWELLENKQYGLQEIFYGMSDIERVREAGLIPTDDEEVVIQPKLNINVLDYLLYLVDCMKSSLDRNSSLVKNGMYILNVVDEANYGENKRGTFNGPYFKITYVTKTQTTSSKIDTYQIDVGFPTQNIVTSFTLDDSQNYSLLYDYVGGKVEDNYSRRINDNGELDYVYAPLLSSGNNLFLTSEADRSWWTNVTQFPIKATLTLKGLLRPAILMNYVKLNVYFFGRKHISSGTYIITKQLDQIDFNGFRTTLSLTRTSGDEE